MLLYAYPFDPVLVYASRTNTNVNVVQETPT